MNLADSTGKPLPGTRLTIVERAYISPIWFSPAS